MRSRSAARGQALVLCLVLLFTGALGLYFMFSTGQVSAIVRMQSPARDRDAGESRDGDPLTGPSLGRGTVDGDRAFDAIPIDRVNPNGDGPTEDGSVDRAPGFLKIGADRLMEPPGKCVAP